MRAPTQSAASMRPRGPGAPDFFARRHWSGAPCPPLASRAVAALQEGVDLFAGDRPVIVEIGDDIAHEAFERPMVRSLSPR